MTRSRVEVEADVACVFDGKILLGFGVGAALQNVVIAIQAEWAHDEKMIPQATVRPENV